MSEIAIGEAAQAESGAFSRKTMLLVVGIGVVAFLAMLVLGAYAPDLRSGKNGGAHALSNASVGYSGIVKLAEATGRYPEILRSEDMLESEDLVVVTPESGAADMGKILERRGPRTTLIVLPKWWTMPDKKRPGWVNITGLMYPGGPQGVLAPEYKFSIVRVKEKGTPLRAVHPTVGEDFGFVAPEVTQTISGKKIEPVVVDQKGRIVLAKATDRNLYILADPDLLNNHGMTDAKQAAAALSMLDFMNSTDAEAILFDVTANGLGHSRSPLKLAFDPPFLAVTMVIFVAMLLAGWQALVRFGEPRRPERAIAFGKAALVDNSASLIRKAGREAHLAPRYVEIIRERAASLFHLPSSLRGAELDERLDALSADTKFSELAATVESARKRDELLHAARRLNFWLKENSA